MSNTTTAVDAELMEDLVKLVLDRRPAWHARGVRIMLDRACLLIGIESLTQLAEAVASDVFVRTPAVIVHRAQIIADARRPRIELRAVEHGFDAADPRHCGRANCKCDHAESKCLSGWLDDDFHLDGAYRCPACWNS